MKISHDRVSCLVKEYYYPEIATRKCIHALAFACWFFMVFLGTTIIGVGTNTSWVSYPYCSDTEAFCTKNLLVNSTTTLYLYVKLNGYQQNDRSFLDSYSLHQIHGQVYNRNYCGNYYTYSSIGVTQSSGGYRVSSSADIHPCGEVMKEYGVDIIYVVDSQGGTPTLDNGDLISAYSLKHFIHLNQYQLSQWVDVLSTQFISYFTVPATSTKYLLVGKVSATQGNYQIVMQNNYLTKGEFSKQLIISEVGMLGTTNHVLGFTLFAYGLFLLFVHIYVCFKWRK